MGAEHSTKDLIKDLPQSDPIKSPSKCIYAEDTSLKAESATSQLTRPCPPFSHR